MSSSSPHGFVVVRRGYRPSQVDGRYSDLLEERDTAQRQAERLTATADTAAEEAARLTALAATLTPPTYDSLGARAQSLLTIAAAEGDDLRADAETAAQQLTEAAEAEALAVRTAAHDTAQRVRAEAETSAAHTEQAAETRAEALRAAGKEEAEATRTAAEAALEEMTRHCTELLSVQEKQHLTESDTLDHELSETLGEAEARIAAQAARAEQVLTEARRAFADAEEAARHQLEDAEAQGTALLTEAHALEERIERETDRILSGHAEQGRELRQRMTHIRNSLAALTGRVPDASVPSLPGQAGGDG
ncbi:cellulose-binding protein [Streptomyces sp. N2-109]|uniref:Cellulose-binding protein n=1 Tax=Streptomyces gossypii TaxID=2883101 RepID=A0ABT2K0G0_9ACTN|nr:cellulose-binding protein [Streptomyces gossypii]MCT2593020.1 cellulose-binding protein [Streptomyces gossypii]